MRLTVLGSGSRGNALLVEADGAALLVDAGFTFKDLLKRCDAAGCDPSLVRAVVLTHEHGDHARGAPRAAAAWRVPVVASRGTLHALEGRLPRTPASIPLHASRARSIGPFAITAYPTAHDAAEPVMLVIEDADGRRLGVAYDVGTPTTALRHALRGLDALVVETNHDEVMLRASGYPPSVRARIAGHGGHLSNRQAGLLVAEAAHAELGTVVLAHLSDRCNRPEKALREVEAALRGSAFSGRIVVAGQDTPTAAIDVGAPSLQLALPLGRRR